MTYGIPLQHFDILRILKIFTLEMIHTILLILTCPLYEVIVIILVGFIECKIDTNPLMRCSLRRESPGTDMGQHLMKGNQGITKVGGMPA